MPLARPEPFRRELASALPDRPFAIEFWDGEILPATANGDVPTFQVRSPRAIAHLLRAPGELGLGRAYVAGDLDVDDIDKVIPLLNSWEPPSIEPGQRLRLMATAVRAAGLTKPPKPPLAELRPRGEKHSSRRDKEAVRHHYDVSNDFFRLYLGPSMTYSCAIFSRGATTLEEAQDAKNELVCAKLGLKPGMRVLDVGCGWGGFAVHAAKHHGVHVTGITLSEPQAAYARARAEREGLADKIDIRVADYREIGGRYDAIASIGMVEHVGEENIDLYAARLASLLEPGGWLLNHGISWLGYEKDAPGAFTQRYVFPDGATLQLSRVLAALERAGFVTEHVEGFGADYAETLRHWAQRLDENLDEAIRLAGPERVRVWRLYLRAARSGFETGFISVYQVRAHLREPARS